MRIFKNCIATGRALRGGLAAVAAFGLIALLGSCGGGGDSAAPAGPAAPPASAPPATPPATSPGTPPETPLPSSPDIKDGYDYTADTPVPLGNVSIKILAPKSGGGCYDAAGHGFGVPAGGTGGSSDYSGCTLAMVNAGVKQNFCDTQINGQPTIDDPDFKPYVKVLFSADDYTPDASLTWNGEMKLNGHSTRCASQKSYEIDLGKGMKAADHPELVAPYHGLMDVLLKKHPYDLTRIRNALSFYLFRSVPDMTSRPTWFLHATVADDNPDDQAYLSNECAMTATAGVADCGLFENIEEGDDWLTFHGQDPKGQFWEAQNFDFEPATAALLPPNTPDSDAFQAIIAPQDKGYDATGLLDMLDAVNDNPDDIAVTGYVNDFERDVFATYFHPDNFRTWLAMNILVNNDDTNSQNFYLYKPSTATQFYFAPWDYDGAWDWYDQLGSTPVPQPRWAEGVSNWWNMILVRRYLMAPGEVANLTAKLDSLKQNVFNSQNIGNAVTALSAQISAIESTAPDNAFPDAGGAAGAAERQAEINRLPATVDTAYQQYLTSLKRPMPMFQDVSPAEDPDSGNPINGSVTLSWDPSYSIAGNPLVYDVVLATSPTQGTDGACTSSDSSVPLLSTGVVFSENGIAAVSGESPVQVTVPTLAGGQYYLQVIARDQTTGFCQIAFDSYTPSGDQPHFGLWAFSYDGSNVTYDGD